MISLCSVLFSSKQRNKIWGQQECSNIYSPYYYFLVKGYVWCYQCSQFIIDARRSYITLYTPLQRRKTFLRGNQIGGGPFP